MSAPKYQYGHKPGRRRPRKALTVLVFSLLLIGIIGFIVFLDIRKNTSMGVEGESRVVSQVLSDNAQVLEVNEPFFSFELPGDWKETKRNESSLYTSISWQATLKGKDNRYLTLYIDRLPLDMPFNRLVALRAQGSSLSFSDVSDNCANFTVGGTFDTRIATGLKPTPTKWNNVDFMCNLPRVIDNEVGTGSVEEKNAVTLTGPTAGTHKYLFVYADRNVQPDYNIFYGVLRSFSAK